MGFGWLTEGSTEQPGYSVFLRDGDRVFHTYSVFARGTEWLGGSYAFLDLTPLGRQEEWEEPEGPRRPRAWRRARLLVVDRVGERARSSWSEVILE